MSVLGRQMELRAERRSRDAARPRSAPEVHQRRSRLRGLRCGLQSKRQQWVALQMRQRQVVVRARSPTQYRLPRHIWSWPSLFNQRTALQEERLLSAHLRLPVGRHLGLRDVHAVLTN